MTQSSALFDGYANAYDQWFITNDKVFVSELKLLHHCLKDIPHDKILSIGCGSGLFEATLQKEYGITVEEGVEPSTDMADIAKKRGLHVKIGDAQTTPLPKETYDIVYLNGCSTYIPDLKTAYQNCFSSVKPGGHMILLDVPTESAYGILYSFAHFAGSYDDPVFKRIAPSLPYPIELVHSGIFYTTPEKEDIVRDYLPVQSIHYYQTLVNDPIYTNDTIEDPVEGYGKGGYVAMIIEK